MKGSVRCHKTDGVRYSIPPDAANVTAGHLADEGAHVVVRELGRSQVRLEVAFVVGGIVSTALAAVRHDYFVGGGVRRYRRLEG